MQNTIIFSICAVFASGPSSVSDEPVRGDTLSRITLPEGFTATVFTTGISGIDGLAVSSSGTLYAASESHGTVYRIDEEGTVVTIAGGLHNPEGLSIDNHDVLYVTEDMEYGRLISLRPSGETEILCDSLQFPEGVAYLENGCLAVTESSLESSSIPPFLTGVSIIDSSGSEPLFSSLYLWSCSDITADSTGSLYVCNELSGYGFVQASILRIDRHTGDWEVFSSGLHACEGISFSGDGKFPLYVAEEDLGTGSGRLSIVDENGSAAHFAEGFYNIEDVAVDPSGRIYVSEDTTGMIILIRRED